MRVCIIVYGKADCPFTQKAVKELITDKWPFNYIGYDDKVMSDTKLQSPEKFWQSIEHLTQQKTFPTIIIFERDDTNDTNDGNDGNDTNSQKMFTTEVFDSTTLTTYMLEKQNNQKFQQAIGTYCWSNPNTPRVYDLATAQTRLSQNFVFPGQVSI